MADDFDLLPIKAGESALIAFTFDRGDGTSTVQATPIDITNAGIQILFAAGTPGATPYISKTRVGGGIIVTNGPAGKGTVILLSADTKVPGEYPVSLQCIELDGTSTIGTGKLVIEDHALRPTP